MINMVASKPSKKVTITFPIRDRRDHPHDTICKNVRKQQTNPEAKGPGETHWVKQSGEQQSGCLRENDTERELFSVESSNCKKKVQSAPFRQHLPAPGQPECAVRLDSLRICPTATFQRFWVPHLVGERHSNLSP